MFKWKNRAKTVQQLSLLAADGTALLSVPVQEMPIPEACVIELSEQFFHDPEPCEIHRGAVRLRAVAELQMACPTGQTIPMDSLNEFQQRCFAGYAAHAVRIDVVAEN